MIEIVCPTCGAMSYLEKDTQSATGWKCSKCRIPCIRKDLSEKEKIEQLAKDELLYPVIITEETVHEEVEELQEKTEQIEEIKKSIKKRGKQLTLFD